MSTFVVLVLRTVPEMCEDWWILTRVSIAIGWKRTPLTVPFIDDSSEIRPAWGSADLCSISGGVRPWWRMGRRAKNGGSEGVMNRNSMVIFREAVGFITDDFCRWWREGGGGGGGEEGRPPYVTRRIHFFFRGEGVGGLRETVAGGLRGHRAGRGWSDGSEERRRTDMELIGCRLKMIW